MTDPTARVVPCVLMRGGTSRGPFFLREWLPDDDVARDEALIGAIGASDLVPVDGVGGGSTLTSKVAIVSPSSRPDCDVDYLFAQVGVGQRSVDTRPNCGNMLAGNEEISKHLDRDALAKLLDPADYLGQSGVMVDRVLDRLQ